MPRTDPHPAQRMITILDWWLADHFDHGRNPRIESRILSLQAEIQDQMDQDQGQSDDQEQDCNNRGEDSNRGNR